MNIVMTQKDFQVAVVANLVALNARLESISYSTKRIAEALEAQAAHLSSKPAPEREAARVGWVKPLTDPLYAEKCAVVNASLAFHEAYHYHGQPPRPFGSVEERKEWDKAIEAYRAALRRSKPSAKGAGR